MRLSTLLRTVFGYLVVPALIATVCLYLYPVFHGCAFQAARPAEQECLVHGQDVYTASKLAPLRLLALGDPQLEGDTSLPNPDAPLFPSLRGLKNRWSDGDWDGLQTIAHDVVKKDLSKILGGYRKKLDLWGNDLYLAHIYRTVFWWTQPTHTVVLGDLLGSQWIGDEEFSRRTERFWNKVFRRAKKVPERIADSEGTKQVLGHDDTWKQRIIAVAGNHDIGYAGDINEQRIERFEDAYGRVNWDIHFTLPLQPSPALDTTTLDNNHPELHLIVLNTMNLDAPAYVPHLQQQSRDFADSRLYNSNASIPSTGTILLTHIPFYKEAGICVDAPFFSYFSEHEGGGIREQNHLSEHVSSHILDGLMKPGMGQSIVLNGHDHEGCDTFHYRESSSDAEGEISPWTAKHYSASSASNQTGLREITVRSMMGEFGGNAGLLSAWWDDCAQEWRYEYVTCALGVQHIWWVTHILDVVVVGIGMASLLAEIGEAFLFGVNPGVDEGREKVKTA